MSDDAKVVERFLAGEQIGVLVAKTPGINIADVDEMYEACMGIQVALRDELTRLRAVEAAHERVMAKAREIVAERALYTSGDSDRLCAKRILAAAAPGTEIGE